MINKVRSKFATIAFVIRNLVVARKVGIIEKQEADDLVFRGYVDADFDSISEIYSNLNGASVFSGAQRYLYRRIGNGWLFVAEKKCVHGTPRIVGMNMYYLNKRDIQENTVHEGFVGVLPEAAGRGVATKMREMAIQHFKSAGFSGVSTRVSSNNMASIASAKKIGFKQVEEYIDPSLNELRYYMVCKFEVSS